MMTGDRDLVANNLSEVIEHARAGKKSGIVSIEYVKGRVVEGGEIYFQAGQPLYARAGSLYGQEALDVMFSWQQIYFRFVNNGPMPQGSGINQSSRALPSRIPLSPLPLEPTTGGFRVERTTDPLTPGSLAFDGSRNAQLEGLKPQKLAVKQDVLTLPLTRRQRLVYMLIDGRRSVADLARCTNKNFQDVERILIELQDQHLVSL